MIQEANLHWVYHDTDCGLIMPWYTLPCLQWLKSQDVSQWKVFEFGAGYSTIWFRLNCEEVISIDSNAAWAKAMDATFMPVKAKYVIYPLDSGVFDCIVVDGAWREDCVRECLDALKPGGYLIIDNWKQEDYPEDAAERTLELLHDWGFAEFKQPNHSQWSTVVFVKP